MTMKNSGKSNYLEITNENLEQLILAVRDTERVNSSTHTLYQYPASFSPKFAQTVIELFSKKGDTILDLFAGVGSFGLECISRKARHVTFVENYKEALFILKKNILNLKKSNSYLIIEKNIFKELKFNFFKSKFDIIFMDPPYKEKKISELISNIMEAKILSKDGILIIHRHKNENNEFPKAFNIIEKKTYGISSIFFGNFV